MTDTATRTPAIPCKICRDGSGRHPVYSSKDDRAYGSPEGYLCNDCADSSPSNMVEITPEGEEIQQPWQRLMPGRVWWVPEVADPAAPTTAELEAGVEVAAHLRGTPGPHLHVEWRDPAPRIGDAMRRFQDSINGIIEGLTNSYITAWNAFARCVNQFRKVDPPKVKPTPTHAADRTVSPRRAAGSRRTKRHARRRG